ncbi:hypothetical protein [Streptomyces sp. NBC_00620]|uniref:hypothetical protein n=1 Tax=Streptomyces sp. NBC_00620 TaxID=2903666 RepID=UPI002254179E|nr:hypothetical protein [Streptomyces sp. NBC_00620]MCX4977862.1 hypothetical protein [Streptomyces sp. NBC_00620]
MRSRVLRPGGLHVYTVRHIGDAPPIGVGISHGDNIYEHGGFAVHFFDGTPEKPRPGLAPAFPSAL